MKQIKTIKRRLDVSEEFDAEVNRAINEGWTLIERKVLQPPAQPNDGRTYMHTMLYAELECFTEPDECEDNPLGNLLANLARLADVLANKREAPQKHTGTMLSAERSCQHCKHKDVMFADEPCASCSENESNWEPK